MKYIQPGKIICPHCTSSKVRKNGVRINKGDDVQEWNVRTVINTLERH